MLIKVRSIPAGVRAIGRAATHDGLEAYEDSTAGKIVRVPTDLADACERIVGSLSFGAFFPLGILFELDPPNEKVNGLWVQVEAYEQAKAASAKAKAAG